MDSNDPKVSPDFAQIEPHCFSRLPLLIKNETAVQTNEEHTSAAVSGDREEETREIDAFVKEMQERSRLKNEQRTANDKDAIKYPEESFFIRLDSSVKKNSAFVKKLKNMTEAQKDSILKDMNSLNLSKYISEVAVAVVEAKLKMSDIPMALKICSLLHQRYPDFSAQLLEAWNKVLPKKVIDIQNVNPSKMRIDLRFFAELISSGIFKPKEGLPILGNLLTLLTTSDKENHNHLNILLSFCRHCGDDYAGLVPRKISQLAKKHDRTIPSSNFLPPDRQKGLKNLLKDYYKSLVSHILKDHKALQNQERLNRKTLMSKGELSTDRKEKFEQATIAFQKMVSSAQQMADLLDEDFPQLPSDIIDVQDDFEDNSMVNIDVSNRFKTTAEFESCSIWEDEDTRSFYESLPDLKSLVPSILYKDSVKEGLKEKNEEKDDLKTVVTTEKEIEVNETGAKQSEMTEEKYDDGNDLETDDDNAPFEYEANISGTDDESSKETQANEQPQETARSHQTTQANKVVLEAFLTSLQTCVNRDMIDKSALNFCTNLNTKYNRKKLVRALFTVPRTRLDLLPFYARLVATLAPIMPHVAADIVQLLKQDFKFHQIRKKDQINIESKIKNVRFIGELVKFNIYPKSEALNCLKLLLLDFSHHQIEMTCNLLETCGRFLYRSNDSHHKCKLLLDQMMRKKALLPSDSKYITMIENAYYFANPPETQTLTKVERPPLHEYIRALLYKDLCKTNVEKILRQIRKLDWDDVEISTYCIKCFIAVWNVKFYYIRCVANVLAGLNSYQDWVIPRIIDGVLEDIRLGMEINHPKYNQRRISMIRYLGELYNYRLVDSSVVFKELYSLITYGVYYTPPGIVSDLDPPDNLFRIRLICQLLDTCGQYFNSGASKKKLDCFIIFFQRYFWFKKSQEIYSDEYPFPITMEFLFKDCILALRPKFSFAASYEEAVKCVDNLMNELKPKLLELCPNLSVDFNPDENISYQDSGDGRYLKTITEVDEEATELEMDSEGQPFENDDSDDETFSERDHAPENQNRKNTIPTTTTDEGSDTEVEKDGESNATNKIIDDRSAPKLVHCPEDEEFLKDFEKLISESIVSRSQELVRSQVNDIVIPMNRLSATKKTVVFTDEMKTNNEQNEAIKEKSTFNLMVMTKAKGNKPVLKAVEVPVDSDLAMIIKEKEEAERAEKEEVKKLTLDINERREMEDEFAEKTTSPLVMNLNRDFRRKYQHPKGAPDADLIFGNK
ncbi:regulator of nonsense transcripts-like protein [Dinothrombium tinctorium]|uniref:Regulator of nonsense transcripts 2 n=1 Tax=Dinothrombium tinctorium TaxID=1965070 RepID=A0A443QKK9_9ACAR|nr:regulator of nonsense transcripts-like protein [Dinothrombium tinctorium]